MITQSLLVSLTALAGLASGNPIDKRQSRNFSKFDYANNKVRGVNLGGWFVTEPWIRPSFYDNQPDWVVDEYTLCQNLGSQGCLNLLQPHWDSWITQDDFNQIAAAGMNHVRIPIGYWSIQPIEGEPYVQGAYDRLATALDWAQNSGLKVMIDLHGVQGSQNGFDNSGRRGNIDFNQGDTYNQAQSVLSQIVSDHGNHPAVSTIELVNEPMASTIGEGTVEQFYRDGWGKFSSYNIYTTFHDGFLGVNYWDSKFDSGMTGMLTDTHHYEIFDSGSLQMNPTQHYESACGFGNQMAANSRPTIAGEWTGALTDCAKYLNGRGVGARYDGSYQVGSTGSSYIGSCQGKDVGTVPNLSDDDKNNMRNFINAQLDAYEKKSGWIFWTWKTESSPEWDMQAMLNNGIFPNPVTSRNDGYYRCSS